MARGRRTSAGRIGLAFAAYLSLTAPPAAADEARGLLAECRFASEYSQSWCKSEQTRFLDHYRRALEKNPESQRSVASCLASGCSGAVKVDRPRACAWRMLILSGYDPPHAPDRSDHLRDCMALTGAGEGQGVRALAGDLMLRIYGRALPPPP